MKDDWYYSWDGVKLGPISAAELKRMAGTGQLKTTDPVWKQGMAEWVAARRVRGLFPDPSPPEVVAPPPAAPLPLADAGTPFAGLSDPLPAEGEGSPRRARSRLRSGPWGKAFERVRGSKGLRGTGCLLVLILSCGVCSFLGVFNDYSELRVKGNTATFEVKLLSNNTLDIAAYIVSKNVHEVAKANPAVKKIVVTVTMDGSLLQNKYGKPAPNRIVMGTITFEDADEVTL